MVILATGAIGQMVLPGCSNRVHSSVPVRDRDRVMEPYRWKVARAAVRGALALGGIRIPVGEDG